jgi:nicotinate phosphoribosyltransferase
MNWPWVNDANAALLTDLYEFTMLESYFQSGMNETAVFDLFVRKLPPTRNYLVACGLDDVLHYLEAFSLSTEAIDYLRSLGKFTDSFLANLQDFRFTGDVYAVAEGTVVFANEPIVEIIAPLPEAQIIETFLMNQFQLATTAASKAARVVRAARGRPVVDFGLRRMHGTDAGMKQARAFHIAGVSATSNVLAGYAFGIPVAGTMAHSYIQSFDDELQAFRHFVRSYPDTVVLVDTYDTLKGVQRIIELAHELGPDFRVSGVRLDSGDLLNLSQQTRQILDSAHLRDVKIFASSNLDEYAIDQLLSAGAPIDGFGVGSHMGTSSDAPFLDTAYKLVEYAGQPKMKLSTHKSTLPGRKQVFRERQQDKFVRDIIGFASERLQGEPLLSKVMGNGHRTRPADSINECRSRCKAEIESLPESLTMLSSAEPAYPIDLSSELTRTRAQLVDRWERAPV